MKTLKRIPQTLCIFLCSVLLFGFQTVSALTLEGSAEEKGLAVAKASKEKGEGWGDSTGKMTMIIRNTRGDETIRELRLRSLEVQGDGDKSLSIFDTPADVRDTKMLTYSHNNRADDQWLYLPALKRVKRISSKNKAGPFMGSEFSFEDLSSFEVQKYDFKYIGEEQMNGLDCYKLEAAPNYEHSGYSKQTLWLDKKELRAQRIDYYDLKGELLKTQVFKDYKLFQDKFWRALSSTMRNHQNGKSTVLNWSELKFNQGLNENDFHQNVLKRVM